MTVAEAEHVFAAVATKVPFVTIHVDVSSPYLDNHKMRRRYIKTYKVRACRVGGWIGGGMGRKAVNAREKAQWRQVCE